MGGDPTYGLLKTMTRELAKFLGKKERRRSSLGKGDVRDSLGLAKNPKIVSYFARHGEVNLINQLAVVVSRGNGCFV